MVGPVEGIIAEMGNGYMLSISGTSNDTTLILGALIIIAYVAFTVMKEKKSVRQGLSEKNWMRIVPKTALIVILAAVVTFILYSYKGFAYAMIILFVLTIAVSYISNNTKFGRYVYAIGGNKDAASLSGCLLYTSPSPRDRQKSRMPSSA